MSFRRVFRRDTGEPVRVPEHWLEHPVLGAPFVQNKPAKKAGKSAGAEDKKEKEDA